MASDKFPSNSRYVKIDVRNDVAGMLKKLAKHRGLNIQELLDNFIDDCVDDCELIEIGYEDYLQKD